MQTGFQSEETECAKVWRLDREKGAENCWLFHVAAATGQRGLRRVVVVGRGSEPGGWAEACGRQEEFIFFLLSCEPWKVVEGGSTGYDLAA